MILNISIYFLLNFILQNDLSKTKVFIHLDKFNERYNLIHIGISFNNFNNNIRYDFRAFNDGKSYITNENQRNNIRYIFPDIYFENTLTENLLSYNFNTIHSKNIFWGLSNKTIEEIIEFEENNLNDRYKLGIYDCRHYVNKFTEWCLDKPTPVWNLHILWDQI